MRYSGGVRTANAGGYCAAFISPSILRVGDSANLKFGTNDFTVECWFFKSGSGTQTVFTFNSEGVGGYSSVRVDTTNSEVILLMSTTGTTWAINTTSAAITGTFTQKWHHLAVVRTGDTAVLYYDGAALITGTGVSASLYAGTLNYIGGCQVASAITQNFTGGFISDVRVVNGTALYSGTFVPPAQPLPNIPNTQLLTCNQPVPKDISNNNLYVSAMAYMMPFNPTPAFNLYNPSLGAGSNGRFTLDDMMQATVGRNINMYDQFPASTILLLHGQGTNGAQNNTFLDSSSNNYTVTLTGTVYQGSANPYTQTGVPYYDKTLNAGSASFRPSAAGYLTLPTGAGTSITGDLTLELWVYPLANAANAMVVSYGNSNQGCYGINIEATTRAVRVFVVDFSTVKITGPNLALATWSHIALVRSSGVFRLYVNGTVVATTYSNSGIFGGQAGQVPYVGTYSLNAANNIFNGEIAGLRLVSTALYTSNFTPPTRAPVSDANTRYLLNFSNAGIFDSAKKQNMTNVGTVQISTAQARFGTSSIYWEPSAVNYLVIPHNDSQLFGLNQFTIECWVYLTSTGVEKVIVSKGASGTGWQFGVNSTNNVYFAWDSSAVTGGQVPLNTWTHVAVCRMGSTSTTTTTNVYLNGRNGNSATVTTNFTGTQDLRIGIGRLSNLFFRGYIADLRISNGVARYSNGFNNPFPTSQLQDF